jgi:hypothetical protein
MTCLEVAAAFACAVTAPSDSRMDWVARKGGESLFQTLSRILPEVFVLYIFPLSKHVMIRSSFFSFYENIQLCIELVLISCRQTDYTTIRRTP